jgi:hypothetical protein
MTIAAKYGTLAEGHAYTYAAVRNRIARKR